MTGSEFRSMAGTIESLSTSTTLVMETSGVRVTLTQRNAQSRHAQGVDYGYAQTAAGGSRSNVVLWNGRRALVLSAQPISDYVLPYNPPALRWKGWGQGDPTPTTWVGATIPATLVAGLMGVVREYFGAATPVIAALESSLLYAAYLRPVRSERQGVVETPLEDWFRPCGFESIENGELDGLGTGAE